MTDSNKDKAVAFLNMASSGKVDEAYSKYVSDRFRHHNPFFEGSAMALAAGMKENAQQNPDKILEIKRVITEDEFVVIHSHVRQNADALGAAVVHIFRFEDGRIAELWDVGQTIPETSSNENGMF
jgi:predicted SnoaL-like aldol condensation-catalyzing enzyme